MNAATQQPTIAAQARFDRIATQQRVTLYDVMPDGGLTFGIELTGHWSTFAINPDGGRAYPLEF
jgi:hypothetical protein